MRGKKAKKSQLLWCARYRLQTVSQPKNLEEFTSAAIPRRKVCSGKEQEQMTFFSFGEKRRVDEPTVLLSQKEQFMQHGRI
jgi:hypothetical protein